MVAVDVNSWIPVEYGGALIKPFEEESVLFRVTGGAGGRRETMITRTKKVPRDVTVQAQFTAKGAAYGLDTTPAEDIELEAKKMTAGVQLDEEDVSDASTFVNVVPTKRDASFAAFAQLLDNATFAVTGASTASPDMARPYDSLYYQVSQYAGGANIFEFDRSSGTAAEYRTAVLDALAVAEDSNWATSEIVCLASPACRPFLRNQTIDGSNGLPIWSTAENTILGAPVLWGRGLRTSAVATQSPAAGDPLMIFGPRGMIVAGIRDALSWRVTDSETGVGALSDTSYVLSRQRVAFNVGHESAFGIVKLVP
jgi:hypothetical protein